MVFHLKSCVDMYFDWLPSNRPDEETNANHVDRQLFSFT